MALSSQWREWDGLQWQQHCLSLLRVRYADHSLQEVPDGHLGDLGIEAFTLTDGVVFQCYAAKGPLDIRQLYERQRDKLTEDLGKLKKNHEALSEMLGGTLISRFVLLVPQYDSRFLIAHARTKEVEVRGWSLGCIDEEFSIVIETDRSYAAELNIVYSIPDVTRQSAFVAPESLTAWAGQHQSLVEEATRKLRSISLEGARLNESLDLLVENFLIGENALGDLRDKYPDVWEAVTRAIKNRERSLPLEFPFGAPARTAMAEIATRLASHIRSAAPPLAEDVAEALAWAAVADWVMRCPIEFEEVS